MVSAFWILVFVVLLALAFDYINGFHDTANAIATVVSTNVLPARTAILLAAVCNFGGAFLGVGVAKTIGGDIADPASITQAVVAAALIGAIVWNLLTWYFGIPSSSSHALVGGLVGAVWAYRISHRTGGEGDVLRELLASKGVLLVLKALVLSPLAGLVCGFVIMVLLLWLVRSMSPNGVNHVFRRLQLVSAAFMAFSHGSNDAQKAMGVVTMSLVSYYAAHPAITPNWLDLAAWEKSNQLVVPGWVILACASAMALGTAAGGYRIIKTMGHRIIKLKPIHGFAAETSGSIVILAATHLHAPVSTTHVISSCIMGVGASKRVSGVRWGVAHNMLIAWVLTIPVTAIVGAGCYFGLSPLFEHLGP